MALGVLGSFGDGMMQPLSMLVLGDIVNSYGGAGTADSAFSSSAVDKVSSHPPSVRSPVTFAGTGSSLTVSRARAHLLQFALRLLYVAVAVGACAFLGEH